MDLVDPELGPCLDLLPTGEFSLDNLPKIRERTATLAKAMFTSGDLKGELEERTVPGPAGAPAVRVLIHRPAHSREMIPAILHVHGGGYVSGSPEMMIQSNDAIASGLGCVVVSVDYRLPPESPHPGPVEDCYAALKWLRDSAEELGVDRSRIGVAGESAGGGLAAALALLARDKGEVALSFQHLIYPMLDDRSCTLTEPHPHTGHFVWTPSHNTLGWTALLGKPPGGSDVSPYAAAARAEDLSGLPPAFIATGALDLFLEEDMEYARRLSRAGVPVELHVYPGAFHGFQMAVNARVSIAAERDSREALRKALHGTVPKPDR